MTIEGDRTNKQAFESGTSILALVRLDVPFQTCGFILRRALFGERAAVEVAVLGGFSLRFGAGFRLAPLAEVYEFGHAGLPPSLPWPAQASGLFSATSHVWPLRISAARSAILPCVSVFVCSVSALS